MEDALDPRGLERFLIQRHAYCFQSRRVYEAYDTRTGEHVALSLSCAKPGDGKAAQDAQREALAQLSVVSPFVSRCSGFVQREASAVIVTEFCDGGTLCEFVKAHPEFFREHPESFVRAAL